jgi:hypothetical protein
MLPAPGLRPHRRGACPEALNRAGGSSEELKEGAPDARPSGEGPVPGSDEPVSSAPTAGGLGALVALQKRLRAAGGRLSLRNVGGLVYEAFEVTRLTGVLGVGPKGPGAG